MIKLEIRTHSGDIDVVEVDNYSPADVIQELENNDIYHIVFGNNIYSKIDIKSIKPIME